VGVVGISTARYQIDPVAAYRFVTRGRAGITLAARAPRGLARRVERLPVGQDRGAVGGLEVIGEREPLDPLGATPVSAARRPRARPFVPSVAEPDARAYSCPVGFLAHREAAAGGRGFELGGARLGHGRRLRCPASVRNSGA